MTRFLPPAWFWLIIGFLFGIKSLFDDSKSDLRFHDLAMLVCFVLVAVTDKHNDADHHGRAAVHEAAKVLRSQATDRFRAYSINDVRGAALWDAGCWIDPDDHDALGFNQRNRTGENA